MGTAAKVAGLLDRMWNTFQSEAAGPDELFAVAQRRQNYSPHILTRDAAKWRNERAADVGFKAPKKFFIEDSTDPSGVTMARRFQPSDEFEINGTPIRIGNGTAE